MQKNNKKINKKKLISLALLFFLFLVTGFYFFSYQTNQTDQKQAQLFNRVLVNKCQWPRRIDGVCVKNAADANQWPVAVMIDNHPDAWPQFGVQQASLVYSTLVEGGTTRLMAIFTGSQADKIGPVRSARPYFLTWAKGLNAFYAHSGGSPEALEKIKKYGILDFEEATSYGPEYFWRDHRRLAPHNLFTASDKIKQALKDFNLASSTPDYPAWLFSAKASSTDELASGVYIDYSPGVLFDVAYKYNTSSQEYLRWQNEAPYLDALNSRQVGIKNIIIQFVPQEVHLDTKDRLKIDTLGQGKAWVFYNGKMARGRWIKNSLEDRTRFYNQDGKEVVFPPGNIWVEVVPGKRQVIVN